MCSTDRRSRARRICTTCSSGAPRPRSCRGRSAHGVGFLAYSPLARGLLAGRAGTGSPPLRDGRRSDPLFQPRNAARVNEAVDAVLRPIAREPGARRRGGGPRLADRSPGCDGGARRRPGPRPGRGGAGRPRARARRRSSTPRSIGASGRSSSIEAPAFRSRGAQCASSDGSRTVCGACARASPLADSRPRRRSGIAMRVARKTTPIDLPMLRACSELHLDSRRSSGRSVRCSLARARPRGARPRLFGRIRGIGGRRLVG